MRTAEIVDGEGQVRPHTFGTVEIAIPAGDNPIHSAVRLSCAIVVHMVKFAWEVSWSKNA